MAAAIRARIAARGWPNSDEVRLAALCMLHICAATSCISLRFCAEPSSAGGRGLEGVRAPGEVRGAGYATVGFSLA